jgi:hypothetical protein
MGDAIVKLALMTWNLFVLAFGAGVGFCLCFALLPTVLKRPIKKALRALFIE